MTRHIPAVSQILKHTKVIPQKKCHIQSPASPHTHHALILHFFYFQDAEHFGDVYQDDVNQAALLLYRDKTDDALLMVNIIYIIF